MSQVHELAAAKYQERVAYLLLQSLNASIANANQMAASRRLEHDEMIQLAHRVRSMGIARDRARDDWTGWKRIVRQLAPRARHRPDRSAWSSKWPPRTEQLPCSVCVGSSAWCWAEMPSCLRRLALPSVVATGRSSGRSRASRPAPPSRCRYRTGTTRPSITVGCGTRRPSTDRAPWSPATVRPGSLCRPWAPERDPGPARPAGGSRSRATRPACGRLLRTRSRGS